MGQTGTAWKAGLPDGSVSLLGKVRGLEQQRVVRLFFGGLPDVAGFGSRCWLRGRFWFVGVLALAE